MRAGTGIDIRDDAAVAVARTRVRTLGAQLGLSVDLVERVALAVSELGHNQLDHARHGEIELRPIDREGTPGLEVVARDRGPGLADPYGATQGRLVGTGLGVGLASVRRLADELDLDVRLDVGTTVTLRRFAEAVPRRPEVAVLGRALPGEPVSGDDAVLVRGDDGFLLAVIDGVGHGADARDASTRAVDVVRARAASPLNELLDHLNTALVRTRGAAATLARYSASAGVVEVAGVGNVMARWIPRGGAMKHHVPAAGTLGVRRASRQAIRISRWPMGVGTTVVLATDGVRNRMDLSAAPPVLLRSAVGIAQHVLEHHTRDHDDALVAVVR
jgi:anti-sigma regulatory factor (Ser/Thr protein kinase)